MFRHIVAFPLTYYESCGLTIDKAVDQPETVPSYSPTTKFTIRPATYTTRRIA